MHSKIITENYSAGMPIVLFIHHYSQPNLSYDNLLLEEVKKGNLYHEHYATICDFEAKFGKNKFENNGFYALKHQPKSINTKLLNIKRKTIGLISIEHIRLLNKLNSITPFWNRLY